MLTGNRGTGGWTVVVFKIKAYPGEPLCDRGSVSAHRATGESLRDHVIKDRISVSPDPPQSHAHVLGNSFSLAGMNVLHKHHLRE